MKIKFLNILKKYIYYKINSFSLKHEKEKRYNIKNSIETLNKLIEGYSISRYGDGELSLIYKKKKDGLGFQNYNATLSKRLAEILSSNLDKHLVAIPSSFLNVDNLVKSEAYFWSKYYLSNKKNLNKYLNPNKTYYDAMISRFYMPYKNKEHCDIIIEKFNKLFENRKILIIEGENTRFGLGNSLLTKALSISRIILPSKNAFLKYDEIIKYMGSIPLEQNFLVLIALGPTATVLAYDLCKLGFQSIDVGHLDIEYEWYLNKATKKIDVQNKMVSEVTGSNISKEITDLSLLKIYNQQILHKIL